MRPLPPRSHALVTLAMLAAAFTITTVVAELAGARNLGVAMAFGQLAFAMTLVYVLVKR